MADRENAFPEQAPGRYYVDEDCINCGACMSTAPENFEESGGHAVVKRQPVTPGEEGACQQAMEECPVECIGNDE